MLVYDKLKLYFPSDSDISNYTNNKIVEDLNNQNTRLQFEKWIDDLYRTNSNDVVSVWREVQSKNDITLRTANKIENYNGAP